MNSADALLDWIKSRGGACNFRDLLQRAPAPFRSKDTADAAIGLLIENARIEETSPRPRAFRVVPLALAETVAIPTVAETVADAAAIQSVANASAETVASLIDDQTVATESVASLQGQPAQTVATLPTVAASPAKARDHRDHYCHCGEIAYFGLNCFLDPSPSERWFCSEHAEPPHRGLAA